MSSLQREGFEIIPKFLPERTILELTVSLDEVSATRSRAGMRNALRVPDVHCLAKDEKLIALARRALGDKAIPFRATLFDKSAESNWLVVWHQDTALPLRERKDVSGWGPWSIKEGVICAHARVGVRTGACDSSTPGRFNRGKWTASSSAWVAHERRSE